MKINYDEIDTKIELQANVSPNHICNVILLELGFLILSVRNIIIIINVILASFACG